METVRVTKELHQILLVLHGKLLFGQMIGRKLPICISDALLALPDVDIQDRISFACEKWCVARSM